MDTLKTKILILIILILGFFALKKYLFPNDKDLIKVLLTDLASTASFRKEDKQGPLKDALHARKLEKFFTKKIKITYNSSQGHTVFITNQNDLIQKYLYARRALNKLLLDFKNLDITVDGKVANVYITGTARWLDQVATQDFEDKLDIEFTTLKTQDGWKILEGKNKEKAQ